MIVVNLFGAPCAGKSTGAAYVYSKLKMAGIKAGLIVGDYGFSQNEASYFFDIYNKLNQSKGKFDVVVTDSPLLCASFQQKDMSFGGEWENTVSNVFKSYNNINYFLISPNKPNKSNSQLSYTLKKKMAKFSVRYSQIVGNKKGYNTIVKEIMDAVYRLSPAQTYAKTIPFTDDDCE